MIFLQSQGGGISFFLPLIVLGLLFYFLLIRPQQREQKQRRQMQDSLSRGDRVVTAGGIHGSVAGVEEHVVTLEVANLRGERVRIKVDRQRVERRFESAEQSGTESS
ncbi:MAG: preprotein translocase subunit YajC [Deltaproteobacteria bacterium]|nr:preprotein translocase subunit YajC [Deltaproteobacteria bacterium]MDD9826921.1 preprotein translocase subunit YajC [Deltaproteobacteria bacterium]MDD9853584.1 preprotein translocase subunit YajC [Deltaproteobacteria bacterium]MDD9872731.1 preprotein translocase subunit YajC [Deltaproteobacteria bacterium]